MFNREEIVNLIVEMRSADITCQNKATPWGRATIKALSYRNEAGEATYTTDDMLADMRVAYAKDMETLPSGKKSTVLPNLAKSHADSVLFIMRNAGKAGVPELIAAFIADGSKVALHRLRGDVGKVIAALAKEAREKVVPANDEAESSEADANPAPTAVSMGDYLASVTATIDALSPADCSDNATAIATLIQSLIEASKRIPVDLKAAA